MHPSLQEIKQLSREGNVIPVYRSIHADFLTPVSAYLRLHERASEAFLLESVEGGEKLARYSYLGNDPFLVLSIGGNAPEIGSQRARRVHFSAEDRSEFFGTLRETLKRFQSVRLPELPPFTGGAVGFFGYDMVRLVENIPETGIDDLNLNDAVLMFFKTVLAFDHIRNQIHIVSNLLIEEIDQPIDEQYENASLEIERIEELLRQPLDPPETLQVQDEVKVTSNFGKQDYLDAVGRAKEHITAGNIFQVVLSQRFEVDLQVQPFEIYRALRIVNPSPYMYFLKMHDTEIVGASPEMLLKVRGREAYYRPIAGTRHRGQNENEDRMLAEELVNDEKERAEHLMMVDLGRNDLGRVAKYGTVQVDDFMIIERYSHVMHLVSSLSAELRDDVDRMEALMACFPAGTVSGAPKVRAMEIIDENEPTKRGVYAGAVLWADFNDNLDSCIAIRTLVAQNNKGYIQAGGGIVADSIPENEFIETINKAQGMVRSVELAVRGFET